MLPVCSWNSTDCMHAKGRYQFAIGNVPGWHTEPISIPKLAI
jgi:hypothetical protein